MTIDITILYPLILRYYDIETAYLGAPDLLSSLILQMMKEDNISQLDDYDEPFCNNNTCMGLVISLFRFESFDQFNTP